MHEATFFTYHTLAWLRNMKESLKNAFVAQEFYLWECSKV